MVYSQLCRSWSVDEVGEVRTIGSHLEGVHDPIDHYGRRGQSCFPGRFGGSKE